MIEDCLTCLHGRPVYTVLGHTGGILVCARPNDAANADAVRAWIDSRIGRCPGHSDETTLDVIPPGGSRGTSVHLGQERIAYLDRWASFTGATSRAESLLSMWPRSAQGAYIRPHLPPPRAPMPVRMRELRRDDCPRDADGNPIAVAQLRGPAWSDGGTADKIERLKEGPPSVSLSRMCRAVIDVHFAAYGAEMLEAVKRGRSG